MILKSALLDSIPRIRHGFSTRLGGVSKGPFATLNLDLAVGDDEGAVRENNARFRMMIDLDPDRDIVQARQVHGVEILNAREASFDGGRCPEGDGIVSDRAGIAVGVRTADCVPVLIACTSERGDPIAVAAVHAGWRGATRGILARAVSALEAAGADRSRMSIALGPAIGGEFFEVGDEVVEAAARSLEGAAPPASRNARGRWQLDLRRLLDMHLHRAGVRRDRIDTVGGSTYGEPSLYFSHRRDRGVTGRHLSAIAFV